LFPSARIERIENTRLVNGRSIGSPAPSIARSRPVVAKATAGSVFPTSDLATK